MNSNDDPKTQTRSWNRIHVLCKTTTSIECYEPVFLPFVASNHVISVFQRVYQRFDLLELKSSGSNALFRKYLPIFQAKASEWRLSL
jgi:hypothetical protein